MLLFVASNGSMVGMDEVVLNQAQLNAIRVQLIVWDHPETEAELVDSLRALQELMSAAEMASQDIALTLKDRVRERLEALNYRNRTESTGGVDVPGDSDSSGGGVREESVCRAAVPQIALATRRSPAEAGRWLRCAEALATQMPNTKVALRAGHLTGYRAQILVEHTATTTLEVRQEIDQRLCTDPKALDSINGLGSRRLAGRVNALVQELDAAGVVKRRSDAVRNRFVTVTPKPDGMAMLNALLPLPTAVACLGELLRTARAIQDHERSQGGPCLPPVIAKNQSRIIPSETGTPLFEDMRPEHRRTERALMADLLADRILNNNWATAFAPAQPAFLAGRVGRDQGSGFAGSTADSASAQPALPVGRAGRDQGSAPPTRPKLPVLPVSVNLIMSDQSLLGGGDEPAVLLDYLGKLVGPIPASVARNMVGTSMAQNQAWLRKFYSNSRGDLVGASSKQRFFNDALADFLIVRSLSTSLCKWRC